MYPHFTSCTCSHVDNFKKLPFISERKYRMVKNFGGKKVWRKGCFVRIGEKTLANVDLHRQSPIKDRQ